MDPIIFSNIAINIITSLSLSLSLPFHVTINYVQEMLHLTIVEAHFFGPR